LRKKEEEIVLPVGFDEQVFDGKVTTFGGNCKDGTPYPFGSTECNCLDWHPRELILAVQDQCCLGHGHWANQFII